MKRLDQGHLHLKLEVPSLNRTGASRMGGEHSIKEPIDQRINRNWKHLHMNALPRRMLPTILTFFWYVQVTRRSWCRCWRPWTWTVTRATGVSPPPSTWRLATTGPGSYSSFSSTAQMYTPRYPCLYYFIRRPPHQVRKTRNLALIYWKRK